MVGRAPMTAQQTQTLAEFLLARIVEDEAGARAAAERAKTPWRATYGRQVETADERPVTPEDEHSLSTDLSDEVAVHIARHDPARVLAECEAKRRIVELHAEREFRSDIICHLCSDRWPCATLRALAAIYADHPDYRSEWRP